MLTLKCDAYHTDAVKAIAPVPAESSAATPAVVVTASRDLTGATWLAPTPGGEVLEPGLVLTGHTQFVHACAFLPSVACAGGVPLIATGGGDNLVLLWNTESSALEAALVGHEKAVKCMTVLPDGSLVTGSWDHTCVVWDMATGAKAQTFGCHTNSVLAVAAFGGDAVLSASGDKTVRMWSAGTGKELKAFAAHTDAVQGLAVIADGVTFASCANDNTILIWDAPSARPTKRLAGHDAFVYGLAFSAATQQLYSCSEDRTARVWDVTAPGEEIRCSQCIAHPDGVWAVAVLPDGDVVTGGNEGGVRVWSRDGAASEGKQALLQDTVGSIKVNAKLALAGITDPQSQLGTLEALLETGGAEGDRAFVRDGEFIESRLWASGRWQKVGTVVRGDGDDGQGAATAPVQREKKYFGGELYDYVFDVDVQGAPLKLPYNRGQSVFDAAQQFINDNGESGVSQMDKEQIQQFIISQIDPADAALIGASVPGAGPAGAPQDAAFSEFAKEAAAMAAAGGGVQDSYQDVFKRMQEQGDTVAFSGYAQEAAEAERLAKGGAPAPPQVTDADIIAKHTLLAPGAVAPFDGFAADKAAAKAAEFGLANAAQVMQSVAACASGGADTAALAAWLAECPGGQRFPALDALRYVALHCPAAIAAHVPLVSAAIGGAAEHSTDAMVACRCATNVFLAARDATSAAAARALLTGDAAEKIVAAAAAVSRPGAAAPLRAAVDRMLHAACAFLAGSCWDHATADASVMAWLEDDGVAAGTALLRAVDMQLITERDKPRLLELLRCVVTLCRAARSELLQSACGSAAAESMLGMLRTMKDFGDRDLVALATYLHRVLSQMA